MKKLLALTLCLGLILSLAACGQADPAATEETVMNTIPEPTIEIVAFEPIVLVDNEILSLTIVDHANGEDNNVTTIRFENKSDKTLSLNLQDLSVNDLMFPNAGIIQTLAPQESNEDVIFLTWDELLAKGIQEVTALEFKICAYDADNYAEDALFEDIFSFYPNGEEAVTEYVRPTTDNEFVVTGGDDYSMIILATGTDEEGNFFATVYLENNTETNLSFTVEEGKINGSDCDPFWIYNVSAGKKAITSIIWEASALEKVGASTVTTVSLELRASDADNWRASAIWEGSIEFNPF